MNERQTTPCHTHHEQPALDVSRNATGQVGESRPPRYLGPLDNPRGGTVELYEDPDTESTFAVLAGETVEQAQARHRANWGELNRRDAEAAERLS